MNYKQQQDFPFTSLFTFYQFKGANIFWIIFIKLVPQYLQILTRIFGLNQSDNCGKVAYPAVQAAPSLSSSFKHVFGKDEIMCLVPQEGLEMFVINSMFLKPDVFIPNSYQDYTDLVNYLLISIQFYKDGNYRSNIYHFLANSPEDIEIQQHAFSGGGIVLLFILNFFFQIFRKSTKDHQEKGVGVTVDVPYHHLRFFLKVDARFDEFRVEYGKGVMMKVISKMNQLQSLLQL